VILLVAATPRELAGIDGAETLCTGIGPVEAGLATAFRLQEDRPDAVLHIGIAGSRTLEPPALVLGSEAIYSDVLDAGSTMPRIERELPDEHLLAAARAALPEAHVLPIGTSGRVGGATDCDVEAMEGFAVLRAAALAGVPALELRAISNAVDEPDRAQWRFDDAFAALRDAVARLLPALA
jgi:predicted 5'-methylthioadenosine/S-adenosylhomocysteine nucleosidase